MTPRPERPEDIRVEEHDRLIHSVLKRGPYARIGSNCGVEYDDLLQEGRLGLMRARETWDPELGAWATYAVHWLRAFVQRYLANHGATVRVPYYQQERRRKAGEPVRAQVCSLDAQTGTDGELGTYHDVLPAPEADRRGEALPVTSLDALIASTPGLTMREIRVLRLRAADHTLEEVGGELRITRERTRQIETGAIAWIRIVHNVRVEE